MGLHLDNNLAGEGTNAFQAPPRFQRREWKQKINQAMAPGKSGVHGLAIEPVYQTLLPGLKREVPPHNGPRRQQSGKQHVRAKVQVMVAIDAVRLRTVQTVEFVELRLHNVFECTHQTRVKNGPSKGIFQQVSSNLALALAKTRGTLR